MRIHQMLGWAAGGCVLVASLTLASRYSRPKQVRAALVVTPESPLVFAKEGETKVDLEFRVKNQTNHDIKLGEMATSCGCTVASISPKDLGPGEEAVVTVVGKPPTFGRRKVEIKVATDERTQPEVMMRLFMEGAAKPPYVVTMGMTVNFGTVQRNSSQKETVFIETVERARFSAMDCCLGVQLC